MKKFLRFLGIFAFVLSSSVAGAADKKPLVVCSLFPQYDFVRQIAGDRVELVLLLPPGMESHAFDPRPSDIVTLNKADLFVFTGQYMEPWADRIVSTLDNKALRVVDASAGIALEKEHEHEHEHEHDKDHDHDADKEDHDHDAAHEHHHEYDPHIWLDPTLAARMVDNIVVGLIGVDPAHAADYVKNADAYKAKFVELDGEFKTIVKAGVRRTLVFGGRFAYLYFLKHYGLNYVTAYDTCSAEGEPSVQRIAQVIRFVKDRKIPCIYHEEFVIPKVAQSIAEQTGAELLELSTAHNLTKAQFESELTYLDIMRLNRDNVAKGLR